MKRWIGIGVKSLLGALAFAVAGFALANPVSVHYAIYGSTGAVRTDAVNGAATGVLNDGTLTWLNDPTLVSSEHLTNYLVKFWIDPVANLDHINWTFDWLLGYSGRATSAGTDGYLSKAQITSNIKIASAQNGWKGVGGTSISSATAGINYSWIDLAANTPYVFADASTSADQSRGTAQWDGVTATEAWAYVSANSRIGGSGNLSVSTSTFAIVTAAADVTIAQPLLSDRFPAGGPMSDNATPEPGSLALFAVGGLAGWRRRRDRLKRLPA